MNGVAIMYGGFLAYGMYSLPCFIQAWTKFSTIWARLAHRPFQEHVAESISKIMGGQRSTVYLNWKKPPSLLISIEIHILSAALCHSAGQRTTLKMAALVASHGIVCAATKFGTKVLLQSRQHAKDQPCLSTHPVWLCVTPRSSPYTL